MKKKKITLVAAVLFALVMSLAVLCFAACGEGSGNGENGGSKGAHVIDPNGIGGAGILDDGGEINFSDPVEKAVGVKTSGEHRIVIGEDTDKYELVGGAVDTATWSNAACTVNRIRCNASAEVIFTLDFNSLSDVSNVGFMITLINSRTYSCISVSTDKTEWTDIGYADKAVNGVKGDYTEMITDMLGSQVSDSNLFQCYYKLGDHAAVSKTIYIKAGYSDKYYTKLPSPAGTDVIGYVSYFDSLEVEYDYI